MIVTVTMNPAIDKTIDIEKLERGDLNRIKRVEQDAGGKGINVSKTIKALHGTTIASGFIGGASGAFIEEVLQKNGIETDFVVLEGNTRTNTKVVESTGEVTELNEPGPVVTDEKLEELINKLLGYAGKETLFVLAGSVPAGVSKDIYRILIEKLHEKGAKVFLDADGELFVNALEAGPDMIKPNRKELEELFKLDYRASEQELVKLGERLLEKGIEMTAVSLGQMGALFLTKDWKIKCPGLKVQAHSTVGAGDAMVAALSYAWDQKIGKEESATLAMATSAGAVTTIGTKPPSKETIEELAKQVTIVTLNEAI